MNKGLQKEEKTKLWSKHYKQSLLLKINENQILKEEEDEDKEEEEAEIRPIKNLQTVKMLEKIIAKEAEVMVEDVAEAVDVAETLKGLKYNAMFAKGMDITLMNVIIILTIKVIRQILLRKKRRKIKFC